MCMVCQSVRPSVTLMDQDHTGWKSWKLIARTISPTPSLLVAQRPSQENMEKFWGRLEVGWEKVACWSTQAAISLKRVKIEEKLLWNAYRNSPKLFRTVPIPDLLRPPLPLDWGFATPPKTSIAIISGVRGTGTHIHMIDRNKSPLKISGKVAVGVLRDSRNFSGHPCIYTYIHKSFIKMMT